MRDHKLLVMLRSLSRREFRKFGQFLKRNHSGQKIALAVFDYLATHFPAFHSEDLQIPLVNGMLFPETSENVRKTRDAYSDLYLLLRDFLLFQSQQQNRFENDLRFLQILKERKLYTSFFREIRQLESKLSRETVQNEWHHLRILILKHEIFTHSFAISPEQEPDNLAEYMTRLDQFFVLSKLKLGLEMKSREKILGQANQIHLLTETLALSESTDGPTGLLPQCYSTALKLLDNPSDGVFQALKTRVLGNEAQLGKADFKSLLLYLINFAANKIRSGQPSYFKEAFELYQVGLESGTLFENGQIPFARFINIVDVASRLKEFDWANKFISDHEIHLDEQVKEDTADISRARLLFARKDFESVLILLRTVGFKNIWFSLRARSLLIRSLYELNENPETILKQCRNFELYLSRNRYLGDGLREGYENFINAVRQLLNPKKGQQELLSELQLMKELACRDWLYEKTVKEHELP